MFSTSHMRTASPSFSISYFHRWSDSPNSGSVPTPTRRRRHDIANIRSGAIARAIKAGDKAVEKIVREAARRIGWTMAGVVNLLAPDVVLLGGGLVEEMPEIFQGEVEKSLKGRVMPSLKKTFRVAVAELGDGAGVTGMAAWAKHVIEA